MIITNINKSNIIPRLRETYVNTGVIYVPKIKRIKHENIKSCKSR